MIMIINYNFSFKKTSDIGPSIYRHPENRTASPGDHVVFTCAVEGLPAPSIIWLRDGLEVTDRKAQTYQGRDSIISELHIGSVEKHHFGKYTCQAANTIGIVVSKDAMLSLAGKRPLKGKYSARGGGGGGRGTHQTFIRGGSVPRSNLLPRNFSQQRYPFRIPSIGK